MRRRWPHRSARSGRSATPQRHHRVPVPTRVVATPLRRGAIEAQARPESDFAIRMTRACGRSAALTRPRCTLPEMAATVRRDRPQYRAAVTPPEYNCAMSLPPLEPNGFLPPGRHPAQRSEVRDVMSTAEILAELDALDHAYAACAEPDAVALPGARLMRDGLCRRRLVLEEALAGAALVESSRTVDRARASGADPGR